MEPVGHIESGVGVGLGELSHQVGPDGVGEKGRREGSLTLGAVGQDGADGEAESTGGLYMCCVKAKSGGVGSMGEDVWKERLRVEEEHR